MAITAGVNNEFKKEVLLGTHNFTSATDVFKIALYPTASTLGPTTSPTYTTTGECPSTGNYSAGGNTLTSTTPVLNGTEGCCFFATTTWSASTITAGGAQIYNSSKSSKNVAVLSFGGTDKVSSAGDFTITFPSQIAGSAIVRIT